jgi:hypothetical protein
MSELATIHPELQIRLQQTISGRGTLHQSGLRVAFGVSVEAELLAGFDKAFIMLPRQCGDSVWAAARAQSRGSIYRKPKVISIILTTAHSRGRRGGGFS